MDNQGFDTNYTQAQGAATYDSVAAYTESAIEERRKQRAGKRRTAVVVAAVVGVLLAAYLGGAAWFSGHFLPNTIVGSYDVSGMDVDEATAMLDAASDKYALTVTGDDLDFEVTSADASLRIDSAKVVKKAIDENAFLTWPASFVSSSVHDLSDVMEVTYDKDAFKKFVKGKIKAFNKKASDPTSATIEYKKKEGAFAIVPEVLGEKVDTKAVLNKVRDAALEMRESVELGEDELLRPDVLADDKRLAKAVDSANALLGTDIQLTLGGVEWLEVGSDLISGWVKLGKDIKPELDDQAVRDWAGARVGEVNTVGNTRSFTTPRGDEITVSGGSYGWQVDYEPFLETLKNAISEKTVGTVEVPCVQTAASMPDKNGVDFGSRYVDVNISTQHAVFYDGKDVLWESDFISGSPDGEHDTPKGTYMINLKESPSKLVGENVEIVSTSGKGKNKTTTISYEPEYETEVQYWMPFVGNAIGFHDATWQPDFGGSMYMEGYGSHGCVNLSYDSAEELYGIITAGTPVIVHG
ncbi:MAG: L,D-transpeptidase family protein [Coriobacteriia bacterium]|nr:L,D-transpeptidase family protein [Coriobacteriia bacterium]